jgi:mRNA interferase RelE/StbE
VAGYNVGIKRSAAKELEELPVKDRRRIVGRIRALANDPRPHGCEKLSGEEKYRVRQGKLRILYQVDDHQSAVTVVKIGLRRDVYR